MKTIEVSKDDLQPGDWVKFTNCGYRVEGEVYDPFTDNPEGNLFAGGVWIIAKGSWRNLATDAVKFVSATREVPDRELPTEPNAVIRYKRSPDDDWNVAIIHFRDDETYWLSSSGAVMYSDAEMSRIAVEWEPLIPESDNMSSDDDWREPGYPVLPTAVGSMVYINNGINDVILYVLRDLGHYPWESTFPHTPDANDCHTPQEVIEMCSRHPYRIVRWVA